MTYTAELLDADFKTTPYAHQRREFELHGLDKARALLWQMRCGKTKLIIDSACALYKKGEIDAVLVCAPNGVHANWIQRELPAHHWDSVPYEPACWVSAECSGKSKKAEAWQDSLKHRIKNFKGLLWLAVNSEVLQHATVKRITEAFVKKRRAMIVFDESHNYRSPGSQRTKRARALAKHCTYRRILTGTPVTNDPLHAFSQYELLEEGALGFKTFTEFKRFFAEYELKKNYSNGRMYPVLVRHKNLDVLTARMAKFSSLIRREDCADLPAFVRRTRDVALSPEQIDLYRRVQSRLEIDINDEAVSLGEGATRILKMQQICSGFLIDEYGDCRDVPGSNPRLEALLEEVELAPGKVIIWCQFRKDMDNVEAALVKKGFKFLSYHGRISESDRSVVRREFAPDADNDIKCLVGNPVSGGQGLNLSAASTIIWYSHTFDAIIRGQADERATVVGGSNITLIDLVAPGVDEYILDAVKNKVSVADAVAGAGLKEVIERIKI